MVEISAGQATLTSSYANASGLIELDVVQEVSGLIGTEKSDIDSPIIQQRKIESTVAVQSGETAAPEHHPG